MLSIVLNETLFDPTSGRAPWNQMAERESHKCFYLLESTEAEIGSIVLVPAPRNADDLLVGQVGLSVGANSFRTISVRRYQPTYLDEIYIRPQTAISGNINLVGKITDAIAQGILVVTCDNYTAPTTPMTAQQFYDFMLNWTSTP